MYKCLVCGIDFDAKKEAKTCSRNCRVTLSRKGGNVTRNVTLAEPDVTPTFKFYTITKANGTGRKVDEKSAVREARYWYDVPLAAVPVYQKDWPKMPEFMNGRQYFLWMKNEFKMRPSTTGEGEQPEIHNPFPVSDKPLVYIQAGENSRHWGTN